MSDEKNKIARIPLAELGRLADTGELLQATNEALALHELQRALKRQAERDLVIEEMQAVLAVLSAGQALAAKEIERLKSAHAVLVRQQQELHERQNIISAVCDAFAEKLSHESKARETLAADVADRD